MVHIFNWWKSRKGLQKVFSKYLGYFRNCCEKCDKKSTQGFFQADRRGRHPPPNKTAEIVKKQYGNTLAKYRDMRAIIVETEQKDSILEAT